MSPGWNPRNTDSGWMAEILIVGFDFLIFSFHFAHRDSIRHEVTSMAKIKTCISSYPSDIRQSSMLLVLLIYGFKHRLCLAIFQSKLVILTT